MSDTTTTKSTYGRTQGTDTFQVRARFGLADAALIHGGPWVTRKPKIDPKWDELIDGLLGLHADAAAYQSGTYTDEPTREAIGTTLQWLRLLKEKFPEAPLTAMVPDGGGIFMERYDSPVLSSFTIYPDGSAAHDYIVNGQTQQSIDLPPTDQLNRVHFSS